MDLLVLAAFEELVSLRLQLVAILERLPAPGKVTFHFFVEAQWNQVTVEFR